MKPICESKDSSKLSKQYYALLKFHLLLWLFLASTACTKTPAEMKKYLEETAEGFSEKAYLASCAEGKKSRVREFLHAGMKLDVKNEEGMTCLQIALSEGHDSIAEFLLDKGADINIDSESGKSNLEFGLTAKKNRDANIDLLTKYRFDFTKRQANGLTAFDIVSHEDSQSVMKKVPELIDRNMYISDAPKNFEKVKMCRTQTMNLDDSNRLKVLARVAGLEDSESKLRLALQGEIYNCMWSKLSGFYSGSVEENLGWFLKMFDYFESVDVGKSQLTDYRNLVKHFLETEIFLFAGNASVDIFPAIAAHQENNLIKELLNEHENLKEAIAKIVSLKQKSDNSIKEIRETNDATINDIQELRQRETSLESLLSESYSIRGYVVDSLDWSKFSALARSVADSYPNALLYEVMIGYERILLVTVGTRFNSRGIFSMKTRKIDEVDVTTSYGSSRVKVMIEMEDYAESLSALANVQTQIEKLLKKKRLYEERITELNAGLARDTYNLVKTFGAKSVAESNVNVSDDSARTALESQIQLFRNSMRKPVVHLVKTLSSQGFICKKSNGTVQWVNCNADAGQNKYLGFFEIKNDSVRNEELTIFISSFDGENVNHIGVSSPRSLSVDELNLVRASVSLSGSEKRLNGPSKGFFLSDEVSQIDIHIRNFSSVFSFEDSENNIVTDGANVFFSESWSKLAIPRKQQGKLDTFHGFARNTMLWFHLGKLVSSSSSKNIPFSELRNVLKEDLAKAENFNEIEIGLLNREALDSFNRFKSYVSSRKIIQDARNYTAKNRPKAKGVDPDRFVFRNSESSGIVVDSAR